MRYAYVITAAMLAGGATATLVVNQPVGAQVAQNAPGTITATPPRPGAPMSFADLAVLKIEATGLPFVQFGDSTRTRVGDWVIAIGNPFGLNSTVTAGIVSALHRGINNGGANDRYIQTDASINQGNSGGPMFDLNGNVIGINTAIYSPTGGNVGIGFAIPAEEAKPVIEALRKGQRVRRGYLGVGIQPIDDNIAESLGLPKNVGELVRTVEPGYAAARAGIRQGDVVVKVNNVDVTPDATLSYTVANLPIGSRVPIELIREGKRITVTAVIGERPPEDQLLAAAGGGGQGLDDDDGDSSTPAPQAQQSTRASLGLTLQALTPQIAQSIGVPTGVKGVVISAVDPASNAATQGLARGDVILSVNQRPATTIQDVITAVNAAKAAGRPSVLMLIQRQATPPRYVGVELSKK
ncbi:MAG TPA: trypsin-like peptidase domain-containing protein [Sphingomonas sp.]|uniref:trypsin-like peptidase domain-containing protein n=1 Tax=Sphingomonas sp. TaxID=28214 RepID=UPI002EDA0DF1